MAFHFFSLIFLKEWSSLLINAYENKTELYSPEKSVYRYIDNSGFKKFKVKIMALKLYVLITGNLLLKSTSTKSIIKTK